MAQTTDNTKRGAPRGFKIFLSVSLAFNLVVLGLVAGAALRDGSPPPRGGGGNVSYARPYIQALPLEARRAIFAASRPLADDNDRAGRRALYSEMTELLRSDVLDREAMKAVLSKQTEGTLSIQNAAQMHWLDLIEEMGLQERRDYADTVEDVVEKRGAHKKRKP